MRQNKWLNVIRFLFRVFSSFHFIPIEWQNQQWHPRKNPELCLELVLCYKFLLFWIFLSFLDTFFPPWSLIQRNISTFSQTESAEFESQKWWSGYVEMGVNLVFTMLQFIVKCSFKYLWKLFNVKDYIKCSTFKTAHTHTCVVQIKWINPPSSSFFKFTLSFCIIYYSEDITTSCFDIFHILFSYSMQHLSVCTRSIIFYKYEEKKLHPYLQCRILLDYFTNVTYFPFPKN